MRINFKYFFSLFVMMMAFSAAASAQLPSLANVGDDVYTSETDGFEIAVPQSCVKTGAGDGGRAYSCDVKEGRIAILVNPDSAPVKTDADLAKFLKGFKEGMLRDSSIKLFEESPAQIGDYRGAVYKITIDGDKTLMVALVWGKFSVVISGRADSKVANSAELIGAAVQSFAFNSPNSK